MSKRDAIDSEKGSKGSPKGPKSEPKAAKEFSKTLPAEEDRISEEKRDCMAFWSLKSHQTDCHAFCDSF